MTDKPTIAVVDSVDDMDPEAIMVCAPGAKPEHNYLGQDFVSGQCSRCSGAIHFSISAPTSIPKVCKACGLADGDPSSMAITEDTLDDLIEILGLPNTEDTRTLLKERFLHGIATELLKRSAK